jgi:hypothetical protein
MIKVPIKRISAVQLHKESAITAIISQHSENTGYCGIGLKIRDVYRIFSLCYQM